MLEMGVQPAVRYKNNSYMLKINSYMIVLRLPHSTCSHLTLHACTVLQCITEINMYKHHLIRQTM
jgi:hypothetical protein